MSTIDERKFAFLGSRDPEIQKAMVTFFITLGATNRQRLLCRNNDLVYMGKMNQVMREQRLERFEPWIKELQESTEVISLEEFSAQGKFTINTDSFGIVDYFPKANKVLIRKNNKWIKPGFKWIRENLIAKERK